MRDESMGSGAVSAEEGAWRAGRMTAFAMCVVWIASSAVALVSVGWTLGVSLLVVAPGVALTACCAVEQGLATRAPALAAARSER